MDTTRTAHRLTTERIVAVLRATGLVAQRVTRRERVPGFAVREFGRREIGVTSTTLTAEQWLVVVDALAAAGLEFTYRCDAGMGARVRLAA